MFKFLQFLKINVLSRPLRDVKISFKTVKVEAPRFKMRSDTQILI